MADSRKYGIIAAISAFVAVTTLTWAFWPQMFGINAIANQGAPYEEYADLSQYKVYELGDGSFGEQVIAKMQNSGLEGNALSRDSIPPEASKNTLVVFSDAKFIKDNPSIGGEISRLAYTDNAKVVMISDNFEDIRAFASVLGAGEPAEGQVMGIKVHPPGTMCEDPVVKEYDCSGGSVILAGSALDSKGNPDPDALMQKLLQWMAED
jgi:hypothetical protein